ncbi:MAG: M48 family metallopeptidase, partial [Betaproteobacteria bacterium]
VRWQYNLRWVAIAAVLCLAILLAGYRCGLPWVAEQLADEMPEIVLQSVSDQVLASLDSHLLAPSKLSPARQEELSVRFAALRPPEGNLIGHRVIFRANRAMPANAIALPSGTIILTDDLVTLSTSDNELMAVLAHELGHIHDRHGMRLVLQGSIVGIIAAWFIGDISSAIAAAPAALLHARYSREFEQAADVFAARMLAANAISPQCLADILWRMEKSHPEAASGGNDGKFNDYLSSHPATVERLDVLRGSACQ